MGKKRVQKPSTSDMINLKIKELIENNIFRFIASYILYIGIFTILYITFKEDLEFLRILTAETFSSILTLLGVQNSVVENILYLDTIALKVVDECTGIYEVLVYSGCVMAYSTKFDKKVLGIALGIPSILGINMLRLLCLAFVGLWFPAMFDFVHYYLWQITLIIIIVLVTLIWIEKVVKK